MSIRPARISRRPHVARRLGASRQAQRGVFTVAWGALFLLILMFAALSVDSARLWMEKRQLQKIADMAALGSVRFSGCGGSIDKVADVARTLALRNGLPDGEIASVSALRGVIRANGSAQVFESVVDDHAYANASQVTVTKAVPKSMILGGWLNPNGEGQNLVNMVATATAKGGPTWASYRMDSAVLTIDNDFTRNFNTLLKSLFGQGSKPVSASALTKLNASAVNLNDLVEASNGKFNSVEDMMDSDMSINELLDLYGQAASNGLTDTGAQSAISEILSAVGPDGGDLKLSDVLSLNNGNKDAVYSADFNLLDLVRTSLLVMKQKADSKIKIKASLFAGLTGITTELKLINIPKIQVGPAGQRPDGSWCTTATGTQVELSMILSDSKFRQSVSGPLTAFLLLGWEPHTDLKISLKLGNAESHIKEIDTRHPDTSVTFGYSASVLKIDYTNAAGDGPGFLGYQNKFIKDSNDNPKLSGWAVSNPTGEIYNAEDSTTVRFDTTPFKVVDQVDSTELEGSLKAALQSRPKLTSVNQSEFANAILNLFENLSTSLDTFLINTLGDLIFGDLIDPLLKSLGIYVGAAKFNLYDVDTKQPELVYVGETT